VFEAALPGMTPFRFERVTGQRVRPGAILKLSAPGAAAAAHRFRADVVDAVPGRLTLRSRVEPPVVGVPAPIELAADQRGAEVAVPAARDGLLRRLEVEVLDAQGTVLAAAGHTYLDEPAMPIPGSCPVAAVRTDSNYSGYSPEVLTDGVTATENLHWTRRAWASADNGEPHWVSLELAAPGRLSGVLIFWNAEDGRVYASRRYRVLLQTAGGPRVVADVSTDRDRSCDRLVWEPIEARALRLEQEANGGPVQRPGILWLRETVPLAAPPALSR
jgi:hypothetical protein